SAATVPHDANEFTGKRILVTGGTRGIGEAIVNRLVRGGGTVLATARTIPVGGNPGQFIQADGSTRAGADHIIKTTFDRLGGLDILIHSVGGSSAPRRSPAVNTSLTAETSPRSEKTTSDSKNIMKNDIKWTTD